MEEDQRYETEYYQLVIYYVCVDCGHSTHTIIEPTFNATVEDSD